jgi:hypothetical protein
MSGGSMDYFFGRMQDYQGCFHNVELDELYGDICKLMHDREWYDSGDYSSGEWNERVIKFKNKWFTEDGRNERWERYIDDASKQLKADLLGIKMYCKDCAKWLRKDETYGKCEKHPMLTKQYEDACSDFEYKNNKGMN